MAKKTTKEVEPPLDASRELAKIIPDLPTYLSEGTTIRDFIAGLVPFFRRAQELEVRAQETLTAAKTLRAPTSLESDQAVQTFIRQASADRREVETLWGVTSIVFNFQRRLVARRKRATDCLEEASALAQRLHNTYTDAENRRVAAENDRRRREAEAQAQRDRDAEVARLEQQALDVSAASSVLSDREQRFVEHYVKAGGTPDDTREAATVAGYKVPIDAAARLMKMPKILAAIDALRTANALREQAAAVKQKPADPIEFVEERVQAGGAGVDRTTRTAEIFDERLFIEAIIGGKHGIPIDTLTTNQVRMNVYARDLGELIDRWPGVRLKKRTTTV